MIMAPRLLLALLLGAVLFAASGSAAPPAQVWPQFHYSAARTGYNAAERTLTRTNVRRLRRSWAGLATASIEGSVAVDSGLVFAGSDDNTVHAYRIGNGSEAWSRRLDDGAAFMASPASTRGLVLAYSSASIVTALDAASGAPRWSKLVSETEGTFPGSPTVAGGIVYVVPDELVALDVATGNVRWSRPGVGCFLCSPAVANRTLYVGAGPASGRRLLALDAATGAPKWSFRPQSGSSFSWSASPAVSGGRVFQAAYVQRSGKKAYSVYAFNASSGKRLWKAAVGSSQFLTSSSPAVANGLVYYMSPAGRLAALRATTGKRVWSKVFPPNASSPAVAGGVVYFGAGVTMYGLDARTGKKLWSTKTSADPADPAVAGGTLYVGSGDGITYAFRPRTG
jgi:outer membrane protein assembly factor BamB